MVLKHQFNDIKVQYTTIIIITQYTTIILLS